MVALDGAASEKKAMTNMSCSVTDFVSPPDHHGVRTAAAPANDKKMTYNEWRQIRKRRKLLYKGLKFRKVFFRYSSKSPCKIQIHLKLRTLGPWICLISA